MEQLLPDIEKREDGSYYFHNWKLTKGYGDEYAVATLLKDDPRVPEGYVIKFAVWYDEDANKIRLNTILAKSREVYERCEYKIQLYAENTTADDMVRRIVDMFNLDKGL